MITVQNNSNNWTVLLDKNVFPIIDYSKDGNDEFSGHLIETIQETFIHLGKNCFDIFYKPIYTSGPLRNNDEIDRKLIRSDMSRKKISFIAITENDEILIIITKH
jgi:hypothetical protein